MTIDNTTVKVTSVARTIADCFKFRNKIGLDVALEALSEAWRSAQLCRVANVMRPYLESLPERGIRRGRSL